MTRKILFLSLATLTLSACGSKDLPQGTQVETGILTPVTISLDRRGTHLFSSGSLALGYAESSKVNLREIEGRMIELTGHFEKNTLAKDLPVFVVESARALSEESRSWSFPSLPLALKTPSHWQGALKDGSVQFTLSGSQTPVLKVSKIAYSLSPFPALTATGAARSSASSSVTFTFLSNFRAVRDRQNTSRYTLMLDLGSAPSIKPEERVMLFTFTFDSNTLAQEQEQVIRLVEQSIRIGGSLPSSVSMSSARAVSSTGGSSASAISTGQPCGGAAGILCPSGQYCEITDRKENIGRCKSR